MATQQNLPLYARDTTPFTLTLTGTDGITAIDLRQADDVLFEASRVLSDPDTVAYITKRLLIQTITITGTPAGGAWTATIGGQTTADIPYNASAAQVKAALELLTSVNAGNSIVLGGAGPTAPWTVRLTGPAADQTITVAPSGGSPFTGGSSPAIAVSAAGGGVQILVPLQGQILVTVAAADTVAVTATLELQYAVKVFPNELTGALGLVRITPTVIKKT